uniref:Aldehyde dehydrogenase domain-containing protein n=1 Tax=Helicotheca tamesis TaxID=374047 RepID=A0A7S2HZA5_9STRA
MMLHKAACGRSASPSQLRALLHKSIQANKSTLFLTTTKAFSSIPGWATFDPALLGKNSTPHYVQNLVSGSWQEKDAISKTISIPDPIDKSSFPICTVPDTQVSDLTPFIESMKKVPKSGLHNPLKNVERYLYLGEVTRRAGEELSRSDVSEFFAQSIMKCSPKSHAQALGEVKVTAAFLKNFGGDNVRFLARSFGVPGDHLGQESVGYRWPFGPVAIIAPFNFPLEIPVLQLMGALFMGNKPVLKPAEKVALVMEQFLHLLHYCGMDKEDVDLLNCQGPVAQELILNSPIKLTQFTGSSRVGELLSEKTGGKVKLEDAGFDWKILGPDVSDVEYVAWQCDQDAYASSGQKCSAQSMLFMHENWDDVGLLSTLKENASQRSLDNLTVGPVLTHTTKDILDHTNKLLEIPGSKLLFGGKELEKHNIPDVYGAVEPTAVFVPLDEMLKEENFETCAKELFAPFQVVTKYNDANMCLVLEACERMSHHLTAAVVSNDAKFLHSILANTVNGTTYAGKRARTTGAPQNHWFGPAGDPRGAGIGTPEAIKLVWSCHREIITDNLVPDEWEKPAAT